MPLLHIATAPDWEAARTRGRYETASLEQQGFIHCSMPDQVLRVADFLFRGRKDLVLLSIDPKRLGAEVCYENLDGGGDLFPHVYGAVELDAVVDVHPFPPGPEGCFELPEGLA